MITAGLPKHIRLDDASRAWSRKAFGAKGYESDDGDYQILIGYGYVVLVSFIHDAPADEDFWRRKFETVKDAMEYAEKI